MNDISYFTSLSDQAILNEMGNFIQQKRISMEITQKDLAERAAISRSTLSLMERGESISLINFIKILRILDALYVLQSFKVVEELSPLQLIKGEKTKRKRVSSRNQTNDENDLGW